MAETRDTERSDTRFAGFETWETERMLSALLDGQAQAIVAVQRVAGLLGAAVERAAERLEHPDGRLVYVGAGTSGRLAVQDGVELLPTFGWPETRCVYVMAGGEAGLVQSIEGAEDEEDVGEQMIRQAGVGKNDVVLALAASGTTPFTRAALRQAKAQAALTIGFANNPGAPLLEEAEIGILLDSGAEVLAGSTRLGAGTAQKAALGAFSTGLMARLGKVYKGRMVDVMATNAKLKLRAIRMVADLADVPEDAAKASLVAAQWHVKLAILLAKGATVAEARALLEAFRGHLGPALAEL